MADGAENVHDAMAVAHGLADPSRAGPPPRRGPPTLEAVSAMMTEVCEELHAMGGRGHRDGFCTTCVEAYGAMNRLLDKLDKAGLRP